MRLGRKMVSNEEIRPAFNIFLYWFVDIKKIDSDFADNFIKSLDSYSEDEKNMIKEALLWGVKLEDLTGKSPFNEMIILPREEIRAELNKVIKILGLN